MLRRGETLDVVLRAQGADADQIRSVTTALSARVRVASLPEGQRMRILIAPGPRPGDRRQIVRVILFGERGIESIAAINDRGQFVSVTPPTDETQNVASSGENEGEEAEDGEEEGGVQLYQSLYETALKNELPRQTVDELVRIFGFDVDFQRRVAPGDNLEVFYGLDEDNATPELL